MTEEIRLVPKPEEAGMRIDRFLSGRLSDFTRSHIQRLIQDGAVRASAFAVKASYKVKAGEPVSLTASPLKEPDILPEPIPLHIVYEDGDMLVVDKAQGMVVHPAAGNYTGTLVNALLTYCGDSLSGINGEKRPGILHRIDKDTSGLLLVAKNDMAHQGLAAQIKAHSLTRAYQALVHGGFDKDFGVVNLPIGRHPTQRKKMAVTDRGSRPAVTHYRVLERLGKFTLLECVLETGRTHQIRVHMANLGHPIVGDPVYGVKKETVPGLHGQLLHAYKVGFIHPRTGEYMEFTAPLPPLFQDVLNKLRNP